jgi:hypothetical protein
MWGDDGDFRYSCPATLATTVDLTKTSTDVVDGAACVDMVLEYDMMVSHHFVTSLRHFNSRRNGFLYNVKNDEKIYKLTALLADVKVNTDRRGFTKDQTPFHHVAKTFLHLI